MSNSRKKALSGSSSLAATKPQVIVVMLRQPRMNQPNEMRSDPFWEYGSFGLTGCHQRNLMHPKKAHLLEGVRFAFAQGGDQGVRVVYLTAPIQAVPYSDRTEAKWQTGEMPFRYADAPLLIDSNGHSDVPAIKSIFEGVNRNGWVGRFVSKFRSRREPLPQPIADALVEAYDRTRREAGRAAVATRYEQALPVNPPRIDRTRRKTYSGMLAAAKAR